MQKWLVTLVLLGVAGAALAEPQNPPPANMLAGYEKYELAPLAMGPPYEGQGPNEKAKARMQGFLTAETRAIVDGWNQKAQGVAKGQTLKIEPRIETIKFIGGGAQDNDMLHRVIVLLDHYLEANFAAAVGGPTGYDPK